MFVGVRLNDGSEHLSLRWTNEMPGWLSDPAFYAGPGADVFIARASPKNKWPNAKAVKAVEKSEYGVILVDFVKKHILSRQGYCRIGCLSVLASPNCFSDGDEAINVTMMNKLGWITSIERPMHTEGEPAFDQAKFLAECAKMAKQGRTGAMKAFSECFGLLSVTYRPAGWTIDHDPSGPGHSKKAWADIKQYLTANDWKSPVKGAKKPVCK